VLKQKTALERLTAEVKRNAELSDSSNAAGPYTRSLLRPNFNGMNFCPCTRRALDHWPSHSFSFQPNFPLRLSQITSKMISSTLS
jgi:hypothetical protein